MPYRPKYPRVARIVGKGRYKNYSKGLGQLRKDVGILKSLVNTEIKVKDINQDTIASSTMTIVPLSLVPEGTDYNERTGRKVRAKSIFLRSQVRINSSATATTFRCILFWDKDSDGENVTSAELLQVADDLQSPLNYATAGSRFKILADRTVDLSIDGMRVKSIYCFRKMFQHVTYLGDGASTGSLGSGQVYMAFMSNETTNVPDFNYYTRFRFIDN